MVQTIYGDVLFLINFSMDFLCLFAVGKLFHLRIRAVRIVLAASLGALYAVCGVFWDAGGIWLISVQIILSGLMTAAAFGRGRLALHTCVFWLMGAGTGGLMTGIFHMFSVYTGKVMMNGNVVDYSENIPMGAIVLLAAGSAAAVGVWSKLAKQGGERREVSVRAAMGRKEISLLCLRDTGNLLTEPYTGYPVIVVGKEDMRKLLPGELTAVFERGSPSNLADVRIETVKRVKIIPIHTAQGNGLLMGVLPDHLWIDGEEKTAYLAAAGGGQDFGGLEGIVPAVLC